MKKPSVIILAVLFLITMATYGSSEDLNREHALKIPGDKSQIKNIIPEFSSSGNYFYPKVIVKRNSIDFLGENGEKNKELQFRNIYGERTSHDISYSNNNKYLSVHTHYAVEDTKKDDHIKVFDTNGNKLWEINTYNYYADFNLSPSGKYAVGLMPSTGHPLYPPLFIDKSGLLNSQIAKNQEFIYGNVWEPIARYGKISFSQKRKLIAINTLKTIDEYNRIDNLYLFDNKGQLLNHRTLEFLSVVNLEFFPNGQKLVVTGYRVKNKKYYGVLQVYEVTNLTLLWENEDVIFSNYFISFSNDHRHVYLGSTLKGSIYSFDLKSGKMIWTVETDSIVEDLTMLNGLGAMNEKIIISGKQKKNSSNFIVVISNGGKVLSLRENISEKFSMQKGINSINISNGKAAFYTGESLETLSIE